MNIPLETAVKCSSLNPARAVGLEKSHGSIQTGKAANLVLLDKDLNLIRVIRESKI